jgi:hypothetical protein
VAGMSALKFALIIAVMGLPLYLVAKLSRRDRLGKMDHKRIE